MARVIVRAREREHTRALLSQTACASDRIRERERGGRANIEAAARGTQRHAAVGVVQRPACGGRQRAAVQQQAVRREQRRVRAERPFVGGPQCTARDHDLGVLRVVRAAQRERARPGLHQPQFAGQASVIRGADTLVDRQRGRCRRCDNAAAGIGDDTAVELAHGLIVAVEVERARLGITHADFEFGVRRQRTGHTGAGLAASGLQLTPHIVTDRDELQSAAMRIDHGRGCQNHRIADDRDRSGIRREHEPLAGDAPADLDVAAVPRVDARIAVRDRDRPAPHIIAAHAAQDAAIRGADVAAQIQRLGDINAAAYFDPSAVVDIGVGCGAAERMRMADIERPAFGDSRHPLIGVGAGQNQRLRAGLLQPARAAQRPRDRKRAVARTERARRRQ